MYKKRGVKYLMARFEERMTLTKQQLLIQERIDFAKKLKSLEEAKADVIHMDETSFNVWQKPGRTWMGSERVTAQKNSTGLQNLTVFGAVGACL